MKPRCSHWKVSDCSVFAKCLRKGKHDKRDECGRIYLIGWTPTPQISICSASKLGLLTMRLSAPLEALVTASDPQTKPIVAPYRLRDIFCNIETEAASRGLGLWSWLAISTAAVVTLNSPESMISLYQYTTATRSLSDSVEIAEFMREVGFRCIGINGVCTIVSSYYSRY